MLNCPKRLCCREIFLITISLVVFSLFQSACYKKTRAVNPAAAPIKVLLIPFEVSEADKDLNWTAMAVPVLLAKEMEKSDDLIVLPLWETMPTTIATAGASRRFNEDLAASTATWLTAKWSIMGTIKRAKKRLALMIDFIPGKRNQIAFRYLKTRNMKSQGRSFNEATRQFLRYLAIKTIKPVKYNEPSLDSVKELAEALDREYGWSVDAEPGKAQDIVARLAASDEHLARILFNPSLYPVLAKNE